MIVGVTGHQSISEQVRDFASRRLRSHLVKLDVVDGISSLAEGADQLFALEVLAVGGRLRVVIPCASYEEAFKTSESRKTYESLLRQAASKETLAFKLPSGEAFLAAGKHIVDTCEVLVAIWDGKQAKGIGGTADVVAYARQQRRTVEVIWPQGASR
jgi:hypothetical protein